MFSSPAISSGAPYIGSHEGKLLAVDLETKKVPWAFELDSSKQNGSILTNPNGTAKDKGAFSGFFYDGMA